jgi:flavin reductase (DIM6/NTAB) family NADH-FMN oxidoreductase RutF
MRAPDGVVSVADVANNGALGGVQQTVGMDTGRNIGMETPGATEEEFRAAMSRLAGGVALITAHDPDEGAAGEDAGMTATAFLSVSLEPPMVLVSVRTGSRMDEVLERQPLWAVSVLSQEQRQTAGWFAMRGRLSDRLLFADLPHERGAESGAPLVAGALSHVECRTASRVPAGDHTLVLGHVLTALVPTPGGRPLIHFRGRYELLG